jgi:hypothetical protein
VHTTHDLATRLADNHAEGEKTTNKWESDDITRGRLSADGRVRQLKKALLVVSS